MVISDNSIKYQERKFINFSDYLNLEILLFGHLRRNELITKWQVIGREETIEEKELYLEIDKITRDIDSILRINIIPRKPIYILTIIQLLDSAKPSDYSLTSYGSCYQSLILYSLKNAKVRLDESDMYINYLVELSYFIYKSGKNHISFEEQDEFNKQYEKKFLFEEKIIKVLERANIVKKENFLIGFKYKYIFYFCVSKYISEHLGNDSSNEAKKMFDNLCDNLHIDKNANILIFLMHHSKSKDIIDEIIFRSLLSFSELSPAKINKEETSYLIDYISSIPKIVLETRSIEEER